MNHLLYCATTHATMLIINTMLIQHLHTVCDPQYLPLGLHLLLRAVPSLCNQINIFGLICGKPSTPYGVY